MENLSFNSNENSIINLAQQKSLENLIEILPIHFEEAILAMPETIEKIGEKPAFERLSALIAIAQNITELLSPENAKKFKNNFQSRILKYTNESEFCKYCYDKPRGYAGDFMAMEMIWNGRNDPDLRYRGESAIGKALNAFTLDSANCKANEYRVHYLKQIISEYTNSKIASIGCGSIIELREIFKAEGNSRQNEYHLFDGDSGAFEFIEQNCDTSLHDIFLHWTHN